MTDQERESLTNEGIAAEIQMGGDRHGELLLELMQKNKGFAYLKAKPFIKSGLVSEDELPTISFFATSRAVQYWNSSKGAFLTVLNMFLTDELMRAANETRSVPLPDHVQGKLMKYRRWCDDFYSKNHREPRAAEIALGLNISPKQLYALQNAVAMESAASLDSPISDDEGADILKNFIEDKGAVFDVDIIEALFRLQLRSELAEIISELPATERKAIHERFFGDGKPNGGAYHRGMRKLRAPSVTARLVPYLLNENMFIGTGLRQFRRTQTSAPERLTIQHLNDRVRGA